jgi:hypothetical protein
MTEILGMRVTIDRRRNARTGRPIYRARVWHSSGALAGEAIGETRAHAGEAARRIAERARAVRPL